MLSAVERMALVDAPDIDRELVRRRGLREFIRLAWPVVESAQFIGGWHLDLICDHLEAVTRGEIDRLVINVPPGCSKSRIASVLWPAWVWTFRPDHKWMAATFDATLARRDALDMRALVKTPWYQSRWPEAAIDQGIDTQETQGVYHTLAGGFRYSTTVGGGATGWHCHTQILDDPIKPADLAGDPESARAAIERVWQWWRGTMASRKADPTNFSRVVIMQRLHEDDLAARCIDEGYTHVMLPMRFEPERRCVTKWGSDPRTEHGELLCPARFSEAAVSETERDMGSQVASAQLQQRPAPSEGNIFKREWLLNEWHELPHDIELMQSWDCTFKDSATADFVCGQLWGRSGSRFYLIDRTHARMGLPATVAAVRAMTAKYPLAAAKVIEDKANGPAVEQTLRKEVAGILSVPPRGGKQARANAVSPLFEAGNVFVPPSSRCPWVEEWREEMASFPFARNDDDVDATTQALTYFLDRQTPVSFGTAPFKSIRRAF